MTVNSSTARQQYNGNGVTTAFTVPFRFLDNTHLQVIRTSAAGVDTTLVLSTDYTVTGAGAATGTITMVTAPASGEKLTIVRSMPFSQQIDLVNGDPLPAETLEAGLDARAMEAQQLKDAVSRSLSLPISSSASAVLPEAIPLALLGWNATGNALQSFAGAAGSPVSSFMAPAVAATNATAAQTAIGGTSVGRAVFSAADAAAARTVITAAASGANTDITSLNAPALGAATATTQTSTDNTTKVATTAYVKSVQSALSLTTRFTSADQTVTGNSVLNVAHGLGAKPSLVRVVLKCTTAELSYSVNDEVEANFLFTSGVGVVGIASDATNVTVITNGAQPSVLNKSTQAISNITLANWRWVVRAWA